ncbi:MAG: WG repeat-containing protein [Marinisporobacter sp.]|nr:WG repeat-containing protein [Marinisporobacter sp.]
MNYKKYISKIILTIFFITLTGCSSFTSIAIELPEIKESQLPYSRSIRLSPINDNKVVAYFYDTTKEGKIYHKECGIYTMDGKEILAPKPIDVHGFADDYILVSDANQPEEYKNCRIINSNGDEIKRLYKNIRNIYTSLKSGESPVYSFSEDGTYGLYNYKGEIISPQTIAKISICMGSDLIAFGQEGQCGYFDIYGNVAIPPKYDMVSDFHNDMAIVHKDGKCGMINKNNEIIIPLQFDNLRFFVKDDPYTIYLMKNKDSKPQDHYWKFGIIDRNGNIIIEAKYDNIRICENYGYGFYTNGKMGYKSFNNDIYIPSIYDAIKPCKEGKSFIVRKGDDIGVINDKNQIIIPFSKQTIKYINNHFVIKKNGRISILDKESKLIANTNYTDINEFSYFDLKNCIIVYLDDKEGIVNMEGDTIIEPKYDQMSVYDDNNILVKLKDKWGVVNTKGQLLIPVEYDCIEVICNKDKSVNTLFLFKEHKSYYCNRQNQ